jgi:antitoxin VapB
MSIASEKIAADAVEAPGRHVRIFRNGANQAVRIPKEFELPTHEATIRQVGNTLVLTPINVPPKTLRELLDSWEPMEEDFPDVDAGLLPLDDIVL